MSCISKNFKKYLSPVGTPTPNTALLTSKGVQTKSQDIQVARCKTIKDFQKQYKTLFSRKTEHTEYQKYQKLKEAVYNKKAWVFYTLQGVMEGTNMVAYVFRLLSQNWFSTNAQYLVMGVFALNLPWSYTAYKEAQEKEKEGKLFEKYAWSQKKGLPEQVGKHLKSGTLQRQLSAILSFCSSILFIATAILVLNVEDQEEIIPLTPDSPQGGVMAVLLTMVGSVLSWGLLISTTLGSYQELTARAKRNRAIPKTNELPKNDDKEKFSNNFVKLVQREQRIGEHSIRFTDLASWALNLLVYLAWGSLNLQSHYRFLGGNDGEPEDYWAYQWVKVLNKPSIVMFLVSTCLAVGNAGYKLGTSAWNYYKKSTVERRFEGKNGERSSKYESLGGEDTPKEALDMVKYEKLFAIWGAIHLLKQEKEETEDKTVTDMLISLGLEEKEIKEIQNRPDNLKEHRIIVRFLGERLGLVDKL